MNQLKNPYSQPKEAYTNQFIPGKQGTLIGGRKIGEQSTAITQPPQTLQRSFEKMGIGQIGGLGGRMGELEKASMRLGEAASQRRIGEMQKEIEAKTAGIGTQAKASRKAEIEMELNRLRSSPPLDMDQQSEWRKRISALEQEMRSY